MKGRKVLQRIMIVLSVVVIFAMILFTILPYF